MTMQDPMADMLTRIRNAQRAKIQDVTMPSSNLKVAVAAVLKEEGFIEECNVTAADGGKSDLNIVLRYYEGRPVIEQIKTIKELSKSETILVFKHSTRCSISSMVIKRFENLFDSSMNNIKVYYLDLLNFRAISDEVGYSFQVQHQSPQLLIIRNEVAVLNVSHYDITTVNIQKYL